jgi:hypothetical protein
MVIMLVIKLRFVGSSLVESNGFLGVIKVSSMTSFRGEVKPLAPFCKILWHVKHPLRYDSDTDRQNSAAICCPVSLRFAPRNFCCNQSKNSGA